MIVQGFLYTNEWEVESADPNVKKLEKRQEIRMRATSIGIDMNHYIVGFKESKPNASNSPEGVEMPDANLEDYPDVDQKRGAKQVAASDASEEGTEASEADEAPETPEEKRELAMAGVGAGSGSDSGEEAPFNRQTSKWSQRGVILRCDCCKAHLPEVPKLALLM